MHILHTSRVAKFEERKLLPLGLHEVVHRVVRNVVNGSEVAVSEDNWVFQIGIKCKSAWVCWKSASLSCLSGMARESVLHRHEKALLHVMQKRSLSCGTRKTQQPKKFVMHSCVLQCVYHSLLASQVSSRVPRHIYNP